MIVDLGKVNCSKELNLLGKHTQVACFENEQHGRREKNNNDPLQSEVGHKQKLEFRNETRAERFRENNDAEREDKRDRRQCVGDDRVLSENEISWRSRKNFRKLGSLKLDFREWKITLRKVNFLLMYIQPQRNPTVNGLRWLEKLK